MGVVEGRDGSQRRWVRGFSSVVDGSGIGWWVSVLGKTVGRGCGCAGRERDDTVEREAGQRWGANGEAGFWVSSFRVGGRGERRRRRERKCV